MLLRFGMENMLSFRDYQEISLVVPKQSNQGAIRGLLHVKGVKEPVVPAVGIYGANASGKSNLLACLSQFIFAIINSHSRPEMPSIRNPFRLDNTSINAPSRMECDVMVEGTRYQYGFRLDGHRVLEEWLYAFPFGARHRTLFHRNTEESETFYFGPHMKGNNHVVKEQTREDSLFLSTAGINNHKQLHPLWKFFCQRIKIDNQINTRTSLFHDINKLEANSMLREFVVSFLREADTGISDIQLHDVPEEIKNKIKTHFNHAILNDKKHREAVERFPPTEKDISLQHQAGSEKLTLPYHLESRGTQTMLGIAIKIHQTLEQGGLLVVDELESGLHPYAAKRLLELFQDSATNPNQAQILFATHDSYLMTGLAPAQIWLCEKNVQGATEIYPLTATQLRKGENLEHGYLKGRYGGVPYMGPIENLLHPTNFDRNEQTAS
ncbi:MAG: ATP-binding protein [Magnetococcales bacterium]|nr:ATP-binding protein [Magnetococcales bacterium]